MAGTTEYKNKWAAENADRLYIAVPKGAKEKIAAHAKAQGYAGYADYIKALIAKDTGTEMYKGKDVGG